MSNFIRDVKGPNLFSVAKIEAYAPFFDPKNNLYLGKWFEDDHTFADQFNKLIAEKSIIPYLL